VDPRARAIADALARLEAARAAAAQARERGHSGIQDPNQPLDINNPTDRAVRAAQAAAYQRTLIERERAERRLLEAVNANAGGFRRFTGALQTGAALFSKALEGFTRHIPLVGGQISNILSKLGPMGTLAAGFIGLMMYGSMREEQYRVKSERMMQNMQRFKGVSSDLRKQLVSDLKDSQFAWGDFSSQISASLEALTGTNSKLANFGAGRFGDKNTALSLSLADEAYGLASGDTAKLIAESYNSARETADETARSVLGVGKAAKLTDVDVRKLYSSLGSGLSTLALQRQSVGDLADAYLSMYAGFNADPRYAQVKAKGLTGAMALEGLAGAAQGVAGMNAGFAYAILQSEGKTGANQSPFDALMDFKEGLLSSDGSVLSETIKGIKNFLNKNMGSLSRGEKLKFLESQGFNFQGARAILSYDANTPTNQLKNLSDALGGPQQVIAEGVERMAKKTDTIEQLIPRFMESSARIGFGILRVLIDGFGTLTAATLATLNMFSPSAKQHYVDVAKQGLKGIGVGAEDVTKGTANLLKALGAAGSTIINNAETVNWAEALEYKSTSPKADLLNHLGPTMPTGLLFRANLPVRAVENMEIDQPKSDVSFVDTAKGMLKITTQTRAEFVKSYPSRTDLIAPAAMSR